MSDLVKKKKIGGVGGLVSLGQAQNIQKDLEEERI